jgi:cell division initiation protein
MGRITPLDIINKDFSMVRKGFEPDEVAKFLDEVRDTLEETLKDQKKLEEKLRATADEIGRMREAEGQIKDTLILAKKISEDLETNARREADLVLGEARLEAQRIISTSHDEHRDMLQDVHRLKGLRARLVAEIHAVLDTHGSLLEQVENGRSA